MLLPAERVQELIDVFELHLQECEDPLASKILVISGVNSYRSTSLSGHSPKVDAFV